MQISPSDVVRVRRERWQIVEVASYERCRLLRMVGVGATNAGMARQFLSPFDEVERVEARVGPLRVSAARWRRGCRALLASAAPPGSLRCARTAGIDLLPHQLEPALAIVRGLGSRVLLADDVGLGKTIQAGLIVSELRMLGAVDRVLVVAPAGLRDQWAGELSARFGVEAAVLDAGTIRRATAALPVGVNPWQTAPVAIVSIDYVKRPEVLASAAACRWDIVIVDEAHGIAGDSDRRAACAALAQRAPYVVLLTATPHSGDRRSFASLCGIGAHAAAGDHALLLFRRSRVDVRLAAGRRVHRLHVRISRDESRMHEALDRFSRAVGRQYESPASSSATAAASAPDWCLALSVLHKRALSSARSLQQSVDRRLAALASLVNLPSNQLELPLAGGDGETTMADAPPGWSPVLRLRNPAHERRLLEALSQAAARAARHESKIAALRRLLRRVNEPAIVFTEYRDTLAHVLAPLAPESIVLHGGMARDERGAAVERFTSGAARILLATDAAGEGLNLQASCRLVVNLELPWNPTRLEQRIGRVDRIGQPRTVHAFHLIARGTGESRLLSRLERRVARARADVGGADPLGFSDERAVARQMLLGTSRAAIGAWTNGEPDPPAPAAPDGAAAPMPIIATPPLGADAAREVSRIAAARALTNANDARMLASLEARGPWIAPARRRRIRARLGGRTLTLWRISADDGCGRRVASTIVGAAVDEWRDEWREHVRARVEQAFQVWREETADAHRAFIAVRVAREQSAPRDLSPSPTFQPGLFDRRTERARLAIAAADRGRDRDRASATATLEQAGAITFPPAELLLILAP